MFYIYYLSIISPLGGSNNKIYKLSKPIKYYEWRIIERDIKIDSLYERVLDLSIRLFALRQPMANDLRFVISTNKISADIERIGDQTKNIAKASKWLAEIPISKNVLSISNLSKLVQDSFKRVVNAYN